MSNAKLNYTSATGCDQDNQEPHDTKISHRILTLNSRPGTLTPVPGFLKRKPYTLNPTYCKKTNPKEARNLQRHPLGEERVLRDAIIPEEAHYQVCGLLTAQGLGFRAYPKGPSIYKSYTYLKPVLRLLLTKSQVPNYWVLGPLGFRG